MNYVEQAFKKVRNQKSFDIFVLMKLVCLFINLYLRPSCISEHDYWSVERYMITREHFTLAND